MQRPVRITRVLKSEFGDMISELDLRKQARIREPQLPLRKLEKYISRNVVSGPDDPVPECISCGVCCNFYLIVPASLKESELLDEVIEVVMDGVEYATVDHVLPRDPETGNCKNLEGTLGARVGCSVYEDRPHVCRDFEAGSDRCRELRRMYGIEPQLSEEEAVAAKEKLDAIAPLETIRAVSIIEESSIEHLTMSSEGIERYESVMLNIVAFVNENEPIELHRYDAKKEFWSESELIGYTVSEAIEIIRSRTVL